MGQEVARVLRDPKAALGSDSGGLVAENSLMFASDASFGLGVGVGVGSAADVSASLSYRPSPLLVQQRQGGGGPVPTSSSTSSSYVPAGSIARAGQGVMGVKGGGGVGALNPHRTYRGEAPTEDPMARISLLVREASARHLQKHPVHPAATAAAAAAGKTDGGGGMQKMFMDAETARISRIMLGGGRRDDVLVV